MLITTTGTRPDHGEHDEAVFIMAVLLRWLIEYT
jgi:hypothetical protein